MTPYKIVEELRSTPGMNDKRAILRREKDNELFKKVLTYTFDPRITFGIKKIPSYKFDVVSLTLDEAIDELDLLADRTHTGNDAIEFLRGILSLVTEEDAQVIKWIIAKDFKAGFGVSLVNDEMKPFQIYKVSYMGAVSYDDKKVNKLFEKFPFAYSEVKMDGRYLNVVAKMEKIFLESRGGKPNPLMGALEQEAMVFRDFIGYDVVINGELLFKGEKDRYKANGIISSYVSIAQKHFDGKDITKEEAKFEKEHGMTIWEARDRLTLVAWDFIPYEDYLNGFSETARSERLVKLEEAIQKTGSFEMIEYEIVRNKAEAIEHFQKMLARGEEGTILKGAFGEWKDGKPVYQIKMKKFDNYDLRITGFNYGTPGTKNEYVISSLNVESEEGLLKTSPGGIKEDMMKFITENMDSLLGAIVEVKGCGVSQDSEGNYSLLHPSFVKLRDDKNDANSLEQCLEISNSYL